MPISTNLEVGEQLDEFQVVLPLGSGAMGAVYEVTSKRNPQVRGAMKVEPIDSEFPVAQMELSVLRRIQGRKHFCTLIGMGRALGLNYLVMSRLGPSLQDLRKTVRDSQFTHVTVALVALQCIEALRQLHSVGFIHRDVKPANFAIGLGEAHGIIHLLDFGICRTWWDSRRKPRAPRPRAPFRGTIRYASIATHEGMEQSRIDDLWSLFYMIVELVRGSLDWRGYGQQESHRVYNWKKRILPRILIGDGPYELLWVHFYLETLGYLDTPDYEYIGNCFRHILKRHGSDESCKLDWQT